MAVPGYAPWHLKVMAVFCFLWYGMGVLDFLVVSFNFAPAMRQITPDQAAYLMMLPLWTKFLWGGSVWFGLWGAFLIYARDAKAPAILGIAFLGLLVLVLYLLLFRGYHAVGGPWAGELLAGIVFISFLKYLYARRMHIWDYLF